MNFKYEMKVDLENSNTIWTDIEILDIIKESNEFLIKYSDNGKVETLKNLTIKPKVENIENSDIDKNSIVEIFINNLSLNLSGWIEGHVKDLKGEFAIVEYKINNQVHSQILSKKLLRNSNKQKLEILDINLQSNNYFSYNLDFLNGLNNKMRKIKNFIKQIKNLVTGMKLIFYSISSNDFVIFPDEVFSSEEEKTEALILLDTLMNNIVDFYVEMRQEKSSVGIIEETCNTANSNVLSKKKKIQVKDEKEYSFFSSIKLEKFILETIKQKIEAYKKNTSIKIEHKNTKDPNVIKLEIKSNEKNLFDKVMEDLEVKQKYFQINLNEKDHFFSGDYSQPNTLKYFLKVFEIYSHHLFKLDENSFTLRLIGREKEIELVSRLLNEFVLSKNHVSEQEKEFKNLKINSEDVSKQIQKVEN